MKFISLILITILNFLSCHELITELSTDSIDSFRRDNQKGFILFYNPECPYSQTIKSVFGEAALHAYDKGIVNVKFSTINAEKYREVLTKFNLLDIPAILWFDNSRDLLMLYTGNTEMKESFLQFADNQMSFSIKEINFNDWKKEIYPGLIGKASKALVFIGDLTEENQRKVFNRVMNPAWNEGISNLFWSNDPSFYKYYKVDNNKFDFILFKISASDSENDKIASDNLNHIDHFEKLNINLSDCEFDQGTITLNTNQNSRIERLLKLFSHDILSIFDAEKERLIVLGIPTLILCHNLELGSEEYDKMLQNLSTLAKIHRKEALFLLGSPRTKFTQIVTESFSLKPKEFPSLCLLSLNDSGRETIQKYKVSLENTNTAPSLEVLTRNVEKWLDNKLEPYIVSEEIPSDEETTKNEGIVKLVGNNFYKKLAKPGYDVVLVLCHDKIDECRKFKDIYRKVVRKLKRNEKILFTECNPYLNEINFVGYDTIPGIVMFPDKDHKIVHHVDYKGKLTTRDIIDWIKENAVNKITFEDALEDSDYAVKEETSLLKAFNLREKGVVHRLHDAVIDQEQYDLYSTKPDRDAVNREINYINQKIYKKIDKHEVLHEIKDDL